MSDEQRRSFIRAALVRATFGVTEDQVADAIATETPIRVKTGVRAGVQPVAYVKTEAPWIQFIKHLPGA